MYENLTTSKNKIGARKGIIPIFIACVFRKYRKQLSLIKNGNPISLNAENLSELNENPNDFELCYLEWNLEKDNYVDELEKIFISDIYENEKENNSYEYIQTALRRWYMKLPKFTKETKIRFTKEKEEIEKSKINFLKQIKQSNGAQELLFVKIPKVFDTEKCDVCLAKEIQKTKIFFENILFELHEYISLKMKEVFCLIPENQIQKSLSSVIKDWTEKLEPQVFEQLFKNNTERFLALCKDFSNDEEIFFQKLSQVATGLRLEDWSENTVEQFLERIKEFKLTAENFIHEQKDKLEEKLSTSYELKFVQDDGSQVTKRFDKVEQSVRGKLLYNKITSELDSMGLSISDAEKRQVLMNILKELC